MNEKQVVPCRGEVLDDGTPDEPSPADDDDPHLLISSATM